MPASIPEETGLTETGAGGNDSGIAGGAGSPRGENQQVLRTQRRETPGVRLQVVEQADGRKAEKRRDSRRLDHPGKIGGPNDAALDRAGDPEAGARDRAGMLLPEAQDDLLETGVLAAGVGGDVLETQPSHGVR